MTENSSLVLNILEELRFILELIAAEQLFSFYFARKKQKFWLKNIIGTILLCLISVQYVLLAEYIFPEFSYNIVKWISLVWYIAMIGLTLIFISVCYEMTRADILFLGIAGYAAQHIEYVLINEIVAMGIWPSVRENIALYVLICVVSCTVLYYFLGKIFSPKLSACGGVICEDKKPMIQYCLVLFVVLLITSFMSQSLFRNESGNAINYIGAVTDFFSSVLILVVQFTVIHINTLNKEKEIVQQLLYERKKQYQLSKENVDIINRKCHDLKHQVSALRAAKADELEQYIDDVEKSIMFYDAVVETNNEVLNTILSEKSLYCEKYHIKLSCIVDAAHLDFMSTMDIYVLLGNALDNAIECVSKYETEDKRIVSLSIYAKDNFLCIQTNNYFDGELQFKDGLPVSTKTRNKAYHGYGMKSMRHLAEKYGGKLYTSVENGIFLLQIVLPMPREFVRLLEEENRK